MVLHNPNNWHWVDKNCIDWSKTYFDDNIATIATESDGPKSGTTLQLKIVRVKTLDGDVGVYQRKGKVISLFDLNAIFSYQGSIQDPSKTEKEEEPVTVTGDITVPEIAYDSERDSYTFEISTNAGPSADDRDFVKSKVRALLVPKLRDALAQFGPDLLREHGQDIQHPVEQVKSNFTKSNQTESIAEIQGAAPDAAAASAPKVDISNTVPATSTAATANPTGKVAAYNTESAKTEAVLRAPAAEVFATFTDKARVTAWSRSNPVYTSSSAAVSNTPTVGTKFSLFGGNISGEFLDLEPGQIIKQTWRLNDWKAGHYATLALAFIENEADTTVKVNFEGIPVGQAEEVLENFESYYIRPIKITFGYGAIL